MSKTGLAERLEGRTQEKEERKGRNGTENSTESSSISFKICKLSLRFSLFPFLLSSYSLLEFCLRDCLKRKNMFIFA